MIYILPITTVNFNCVLRLFIYENFATKCIMEQVFILAISITFLFFVLKIVEMKYLDKEIKPFKLIFRDTIIVFVCSMIASFTYFHFNKHIHDFFNIITATPTLSSSANTPVFTDDPGF